MIVISLIFLTFLVINIIINSTKTRNMDEYMKEIEKDLCEELKVIK
jgi:hypothetical protein